MLIFLTIPGLRDCDLNRLPNLTALFHAGSKARLQHSFPAVTWPSQATMLTGKNVDAHGVVANGFYWRDEHKVEMWTAWNDKIQSPQIWDLLRTKSETGAETTSPKLKSAAWFPMLSKGCNADFVCMPAPIHKPDGSEDLWCYTKPQEFYGELLDELGHFPLMNFWGPLSSIKSTDWIVDSAIRAVKKFQPDFFYVYLPHLDYAAQKDGPDSEAAMKALDELNTTIGRLVEQASAAADSDIDWIAASEYVITNVDHVAYPNRLLREAKLLTVQTDEQDRETIAFEQTPAWAMVDHQFSHVFVRDRDAATIEKVVTLFKQSLNNEGGLAEVLAGDDRAKYSMDHERSGDVILVSNRNSWQAYYWWLDDARAPEFANKVDIHRKPGYDPVELFFDPATKGVPLDATLVKGSHGAPANDADQQGVLLVSKKLDSIGQSIRDTEVCDLAISLVKSSAS